VFVNKADLTFILKILKPNSLKDSTGNSKESSTTIILFFGSISNIKLPKREDLPDPLVPAIKTVLPPSIKKLNNPAVKELIILFCMNKGNVQGSSLCFLIA